MWLGRPGKLPEQYSEWYPDYIFKRLIPKMKSAEISESQIIEILVENPRRFLGGA